MGARRSGCEYSRVEALEWICAIAERGRLEGAGGKHGRHVLAKGEPQHDRVLRLDRQDRGGRRGIGGILQRLALRRR